MEGLKYIGNVNYPRGSGQVTAEKPPSFDEPMTTMPVTKTLIDCHVHLAALPTATTGCYISLKTLRSPLFRFPCLETWPRQRSGVKRNR